MRLYGKTEVPNSAFECIGGPLCGSLIHPTGSGKGKYKWRDINAKDGKYHYYRLVMLCDVVRPKSAIFFHYFGTNKKIASRSEPFLIPGKRLWHAVIE
jgi:hypothetical protein